jgi:hypothetical protein
LHFFFLRSPTCTFKFHGSETTFSTCCFTMFSFASSQHFQSNHIYSLKQHCSSVHLLQLKLSCFQLTLVPVVLLLRHTEPIVGSSCVQKLRMVTWIHAKSKGKKIAHLDVVQALDEHLIQWLRLLAPDLYQRGLHLG